MLIDNLRISAFRGIATQLDLDFSARLTLIHAPNGTGKTSVCDAIEWSLAGAVERLPSDLRGGDSEGIRNLFAGERPTFVEANLRVVDGTLRVRRLGVGQNTRWEQEGGRKLELNKLLERLAPADIPARSVREQNLNRASWFRAVRLIAGNNVELLLDDTDEAQDLRGMLFANLFGAGEMERQESILQKVRDSMTPQRRVEAELVQVQREIKEIEVALSSAGETAGEPSWTAARQHLETAAKDLGVSFESGYAYQSLASKLDAVYQMKEQQLLRVRTALDAVTRGWARSTYLVEEISSLEAAQASDSARLTRRQDELEAAKVAAHGAAASLASWAHWENVVNRLSPVNPRHMLEEALVRWGASGGVLDAPLDVEALREAVRQANLQKSQLENQHAVFATAALQVSQWIELAVGIRASEVRIASIQLPTPDDVANNDAVLTSASEALRKIDGDIDALAGPLERLKAEGQRLLRTLPDEQQCPLCAHDYGSSAGLRSAINAGIRALPAAIVALTELRRIQEARASEAAQRKAEWDAKFREVAQLRLMLANTQDRLRAGWDLLRSSGVVLPALDADDFSQCFDEARARIETALAEQQQLCVRATVKLQNGEDLAECESKVMGLAEPLRPFMDNGEAVPALKSLPLAQWPAAVDQLASRITRIIEIVTATASAARTADERQREIVAGVSADVTHISAALAARQARLNELRGELFAFEEQWRIAAGNMPRDRGVLDQLSTDLVSAVEQSGKIRIQLGAAAQCIMNAEQAVARKQQLDVRRTRLAELRTEILRFQRLEKRRSELDDAISALRNAKESYIQQQIRPLCRVIAALYVRAQSNSFITDIGTDGGSTAHRWMATAGDCQLESIAQLSQGQRQDFALSIFLARARDVRGTFFMDEPLQHLDDLNRVAMLDVLRVLVCERHAHPIRFVVTTASNAVVRHFRSKFSLLSQNEHGPALRVYRLTGGPRDGVSAEEEKIGVG